MNFIRMSLEYIRPSGWPIGSYSFVWFYLVTLIILYLIYYKIKEYIIRRQVFSQKRMNEHSVAMSYRWKTAQEDLTGVPEPEEDIEPQRHRREFYFNGDPETRRNMMSLQRMQGRGSGLGQVAMRGG